MAKKRNTTLLSWNVNGIRAAQRKGFLDWLAESGPDVLGVQETKAWPEQLDEKLLTPPGYVSFFSCASRKGYSGTALFSREEPSDVRVRLGRKGFDDEGRVVIADFPAFTFINVYIPNGRSDLSRVPFKLSYCDHLLALCQKLRKKGRSLVLCGDFNTAHREIDLARPKENVRHTGFLPQERAWLDKFTIAGYIDTFRHLHPDEAGAYTWWDQRTRARPRNVGWRLDYIFVTKDLLPSLRSAFIQPQIQGSDHCPVGISLAL
jgi:exodeoxyribonuclease-3